MAKLLPRDEELFAQIAREHIYVNPVLWTIIYQYLGDCISVINVLVRYYIDSNLAVPKKEAERILIYTNRMIEIIQKLTDHNLIKADEPDPLLQRVKKENLKFDPITDELFGNYVRNDIYMITLIITDYLDPLDTREAISIEHAGKILEYTRSTMRFMDRLREATSRRLKYD
jgi:hypothetical protein